MSTDALAQSIVEGAVPVDRRLREIRRVANMTDFELWSPLNASVEPAPADRVSAMARATRRWAQEYLQGVNQAEE